MTGIYEGAGGSAFLGRRGQAEQARGASDSARGTAERRARSDALPAAAGVGGAGLRPAGADDGEGRG